jgi:uncharacterized phage-associated protein
MRTRAELSHRARIVERMFDYARVPLLRIRARYAKSVAASRSAHDVAAELRRRIPDLGHVKLHKLLYYCQGYHLAAHREPFFTEGISAWNNGPVVAQLWRDERDGWDTPPREAPERPLTDAELNTVGYVVSRYGAYTGAALIGMTHKEDPWRNADENRAPGGDVEITHEALSKFFARSQSPLPPAAMKATRDRLAALGPDPCAGGSPDSDDLRELLDID